MRILGVDPGINITGYGCVAVKGRTLVLEEAGVIKPQKSDNLSIRLTDLYDGFKEIIEDFKPNVVVVEEVFSHIKYPKTAIIMGHARGVIIVACGINKIDVVDYPATRIKKALTGSGHASKEQVQRMIMQVLNLNEAPSPLDITDALAVAVCHANMNNLV